MKWFANMKKPRVTLIFIILMTLTAITLSWPTTPVKFNIGFININIHLYSHVMIAETIFKARI